MTPRHKLKTLARLSLNLGFDPRALYRSLRDLPHYLKTLQEFRRGWLDMPFDRGYLLLAPCFGERFVESGSAKGHYFHQDLLVARRIFESNPEKHVDVGSRIDGFVAHVASFRPIEVMDIRNITSKTKNVEFIQTDFQDSLRESLVSYTDSLSCLHALEHFGLGRYGDPVDAQGHVKGFENLRRLLRPGGRLYLSVPIGPQRIEFNAHRVFSISYMLNLLSKDFQLLNFSFVDDEGDLHESVQLTDKSIENNFGCVYGCGIFECTKQDI